MIYCFVVCKDSNTTRYNRTGADRGVLFGKKIQNSNHGLYFAKSEHKKADEFNPCQILFKAKVKYKKSHVLNKIRLFLAK